NNYMGECFFYLKFQDLEKTTLNFIWRNKKPRIAKSSLYNKAISGGITIPDFKLYYRATVLKTAWYWHKNRHVDQWNRIEDPDINPYRYEHRIIDKEAKTIKWKKECIFNKWCWHNWMSICRRLQIDPYLSRCTKLKSKWIKDLNINPDTLNLIEEKVGNTLECIGTGDHFLNVTPTAQTLSTTINQWDHMKLRSFCRAKDTVTKTKHQPTEWEKSTLFIAALFVTVTNRKQPRQNVSPENGKRSIMFIAALFVIART
ncbi:hypothetical protein STEG23_016814, partial [Scotinomys teguina]